MEITPEPSEPERQAILRALEPERDGDPPVTPWRQVALEPDDQAGAPPRHNRGATRA